MAGSGEENQNPNQQTKGSLRGGKSCKGCLYYSSVLKSKSKNPTCVGIPKTLNQVPSYVISESETERSKEWRDLKDFKYGCVGYSVFLDNKGSLTNQPDKQVELPVCVGLEVLLDSRPSSTDHAQRTQDRPVPAYPQPQPQPRANQPVHSTADEYISRFKRSAGIVASGVSKNLNKVGNYIKESLDDILYKRK
ncbi:hypothetical protein SLA2020_054390 [Shorea laevis]